MRAIRDARLILGIKTQAEYVKAQERVLRDIQRKTGITVDTQEMRTPLIARIEHGRWIADCACGSGIAIHPDWPQARCMGYACGRVYRTVVIPAQRIEIEQELVKRPGEPNRNWIPGETVDDLKRERKQREEQP